MIAIQNHGSSSTNAGAGIYIHVPFCKQACHYCDFHFSTNLKQKDALISALKKELHLRKNELGEIAIETIYFGGGTPSLLTIDELNDIFEFIYSSYTVVPSAEVTLEANPDDLSINYIIALSTTKVNRLSIGIQSFSDTDLRLMNRAHSSKEAQRCLEAATSHFNNCSIDLIYGIPNMGDERWRAMIQEALKFNIPHISAYALTVEPKTALAHFIAQGKIQNVDDEQAQRQYHILVEVLGAHGFVNYEISNFGKPDYFSRNNTAYWQGRPYLGIGPSAHSYDGKRRGWNVRNNSKYIRALQEGLIPITYEELSDRDRYNEYVMTGLRTIWGVSLQKVRNDFGRSYRDYLVEQAEKYVEQHFLFWDNDVLLATKKGKFLVDGIASNLFMLNLSH